jgi:hypothetical protein
MPRLLKHIIAIVILLIVAGCAGGGCGSGCSGCAGFEPLPAGFKPEARIENAGSVRLTSSGLDFLEKNIGTLAQTLIGGSANGGVMTFEIPESGGQGYTACPGGADPNANPPKCVAEIDIGKAALNIDTQNPRHIVITGPIPIRLQNLPLDTFLGDTTVVLNDGGSCPGGGKAFAQIPIDVSISIEIDAVQDHIRYGYSKVRIEKLAPNQKAIEDSLNFCGGFAGARSKGSWWACSWTSSSAP